MGDDIVNQIQNNEIKVFYMRDVPDEYLACRNVNGLVNALKGNTSITTIRFSQDFLGCLFGTDRVAMVEAVGKLKNVETIALSEAGLHVPAIVNMVKSAKKLKSLTLQAIVLQGLDYEFDDLELALKTHPSLKSFSMHECVAPIGGIDLDKLVEAGNNSDGQLALPDLGSKRSSDGALAA